MSDKTSLDITLTKTNKKEFDESLQKIRHKEKDGIKYRKRIQRELEEEKYAKDELKEIQNPTSHPL